MKFRIGSALVLAISGLSCGSMLAQPAVEPQGEIAWEQPYSTGLLFLAREDWDVAFRYFERALKANPRDPRPWFQAGLCLGKLGDTEGKLRYYRHAIRLDPKYADPHYSLGISYILVGRPCDAIKEYVLLKSLDKTLAERLEQLLEIMTDDPQGTGCSPGTADAVRAL